MTDRTEEVRALACSAPDRWESLHLVHRSGGPRRTDEVEAWLRHGELRARRACDGLVRHERGAPGTSWPVRDLEPIFESYQWAAMLDPYELGEGVRISEIRDDALHGRAVLCFVAHADEGYEPICACCPLVFSEITQRYEFGDDWRPELGVTMPDGCELALDVAVGIVVSSRERRPGGSWFENRIVSVTG